MTRTRTVDAICMALTVLLILIGTHAPAQGQAPPPAQEACMADLRELMSILQRNGFNERPVLQAVDTLGVLITLMANLSTGSWSVIVTPPGGRSCLVGTGEDFRFLHRDYLHLEKTNA